MKNNNNIIFALLFFVLFSSNAIGSTFERKEFKLGDRDAFVVLPNIKSETIPWVWFAPGIDPSANNIVNRLLNQGIAVAGIDAQKTYGSPEGVAIYKSLYDELTQKYDFSDKPCLFGQSRGGLMLLSWGSDYSKSFSCFVGIYPVIDFYSWPGLGAVWQAYYGTTLEKKIPKFVKKFILSWHEIPDRLESISEQKIPVILFHGDNDSVVPLEKNSAVFQKEYSHLGGNVKLKIIKNGKHEKWDYWNIDDEVVEFIQKNISIY